MVREHGRDLALVADILGHADVKTTSHYARSDLEDRRAALEDLAELLHSHADAQLLSGAGGTDPIVPSFHISRLCAWR